MAETCATCGKPWDARHDSGGCPKAHREAASRPRKPRVPPTSRGPISNREKTLGKDGVAAARQALDATPETPTLDEETDE